MLVIRNFRRLPPLLRVVDITQWLLLLMTLAVFVSYMRTSWSILAPRSFSPHVPVFFLRDPLIGFNLILLNGACTFVLSTYSLRFRQPDRRTFPLSSWQSQMRALALLAFLPLCGLMLAFIIPPVFPVYYLAFGVAVLATGVFIAANALTYLHEIVGR